MINDDGNDEWIWTWKWNQNEMKYTEEAITDDDDQ